MSVGKLTRYGLPYSNVVAAGVATNNVSVGRTLEVLTLKLGGTALTKAMLTAIRVKANGKAIVDATGAQLDAINKYRGETANAGFLDVQFADMSMSDEFSRMVGSFDTSQGIANITTEATIAGATAPVLTPILIESARSTQREAAYAGMIAKLLAYPYNTANGGKLPVTVPFGPKNGAIIKRLHVFHGGAMTGLVVKQDGLVVHESIKAENEYQQTKAGRVPQTNVYTADFVLDGSVAKALNTRDANSLEWLMEFSGADNGTILVEYLDVLGNL